MSKKHHHLLTLQFDKKFKLMMAISIVIQLPKKTMATEIYCDSETCIPSTPTLKP